MSLCVGGVDNIPSNSESQSFAKVVINGKTFSALLDTKSAVDIIGPTVAEYVSRQGLSSVERSVALNMADGLGTRAKLGSELVGLIMGKPWTWDAVYLSSLPSDLILGFPTIKALNLIKIASGISAFHDESLANGCRMV